MVAVLALIAVGLVVVGLVELGRRRVLGTRLERQLRVAPVPAVRPAPARTRSGPVLARPRLGRLA